MELDFIDENVRIGCHIGKLSSLYESVFSALRYPVNCAQIYLGSSRGYALPKVSKEDIKMTRQLVKYFNFNVYVHSCLLYNLNGGTHIDNIDELIKTASTEKKKEALLEEKRKIPTNFQSTIDGLICELDICADAFGTGVVVHVGSGKIKDKAIVRIASTIEKVIKGDKKRKIILENSAGEGNKLGATLEEIKKIYDLIDGKYYEQINLCIDTCHLYAAGDYDIEKVSEVKRFFNDFDKIFGIKKLKLIHLNDAKFITKKGSKKNERSFGNKIDRHENLEEGSIFSSKEGKEALKYIINFCNKNKIDMVLETPGKHDINVQRVYDCVDDCTK